MRPIHGATPLCFLSYICHMITSTSLVGFVEYETQNSSFFSTILSYHSVFLKSDRVHVVKREKRVPI